jgi:cytochrome c-type biogenesis protein CcmH
MAAERAEAAAWQERVRRIAVLALALALLWLPAAAGGSQPRTSLSAVQDDLMCVACHEPLAVSQSPQAESERQLIRQLIARGYTKARIERVMVAQYGPSVLARPPASGFNLSVYLLPPAAVLAGLAIVGFAVVRWRRNAGRRATSEPPAAALPSSDLKRLDDELARYRG